MPKGNVTQVERLNRQIKIKELLEKNMSPQDIADEIGMSIEAVKRNIKYLEDVNVSLLSPEEVEFRRKEANDEVDKACETARELIDICKENMDMLNAKKFHDSWLAAIKLKAELYALKDIKVETVVNNTQINSYDSSPQDEVDEEYIRNLRQGKIYDG